MSTRTITAVNRLWIIDSTLRDGEQAPGVCFSLRDKLRIAEGLVSAGVPELECGTPAMGDAECREIGAVIQQGLPVRLTGWCRAKSADLDAAARAGLDSVHIAFPVSEIQLRAMDKPKDWIAQTLPAIVAHARKRFAHVSVGAQDASRTPIDHLLNFVQLAAASGVHRVRIADTVGAWNSFDVFAIFEQLRSATANIKLEFHGHNDLGMATANTIAAIKGGADCVSVTVNGLGERAGNAALEQVAAAIHYSLRLDCGVRLNELASLSSIVAQAAGRPLPAGQPITGGAAFQHESGIHCSALLRDPSSYQLFRPEEVGRLAEEFVVGKHSGTAAIVHVLATHGVVTTRDAVLRMLDPIRQLATQKKKPLTASELAGLFHRS